MRKPLKGRKRKHPKKRGRKSKSEREQWLKEKQLEKNTRPIYEK